MQHLSQKQRVAGFIRFIGILAVMAGLGLYALLTIIGEWRTGVGFGGMTAMVGGAIVLATVFAPRQGKEWPRCRSVV